MLFLFNSRVPEGVTREEVIEHLEKRISKDTWELIRKGTIAHWMFKTGNEPGLVVIANCQDVGEAQDLIRQAPLVTDGILEFEIDPVNQFPEFE